MEMTIATCRFHLSTKLESCCLVIEILITLTVVKNGSKSKAFLKIGH